MLLATISLLIGFLVLAFCLIANKKATTRLKSEVSVLQKLNTSLSEREEFLALLERISNRGSWEFDILRKTIKWSAELYKIYGVESSKIIVDLAFNEHIVAPEYRVKVMKELNAAIENKSSFVMEYQVVQPSGIRKYVLAQGTYLATKNEQKLIGAVQDITELKEAVLKIKINESLLREAEMVSHSGSWEWLDGKEFHLWSDEMYNIHGFMPHSVFVNAKFYQSLVHKDDLKYFLKSFIRARSNKAPFKLNYRIVRPSGEVRHVLSTAEYKRIGLNENYAYIGNTQDVTELREAQVQLEEKVIELNRSNQDLEQFAYVASHDLQEPLRKIQAFGGRLKDRFATQLDADAIDYIDRMRGAAERMRALINDLLTFSKATRNNRKFAVVDLGVLIHKTIKELDLIVEQKKAILEVVLDYKIDGIESQLEQLFQNLIGNALKFTKPGVAPDITFRASLKNGSELNIADANQNQSYCVIEVADNGIGFEEEDAVKIFDIFQRLHSRADYEGTGIGLAICKKIAENHSGFIFAANKAEQGAVFTVVLPVKQLSK